MKLGANGNEFTLINRIAKTIGTPSKNVLTGIGDDAAVVALPSTSQLLLCSDSLLEGVDFDLRYASPKDLGHKAIASALSDIAAMNGRPLYVLISLALPKSVEVGFVDGFYSSAQKLAEKFKFDIVGGDLSSSKNGIFIDVMCVGETSHPILRSGARPGDLIAVSGTLGKSAAGLHALQAAIASVAEVDPELRQAHLRPNPRFDLLSAFEDSTCSSLIDISDGLASELEHIAAASAVGMRIDAEKIPIDPSTISYGKKVCIDPLEWAIHGGEDYELLATFHDICPENFTVIGRVTSAAEGRVQVYKNGIRQELNSKGFDHFS